MGTLEGRVAWITGAGSGIGRGTAVRLAAEGADVCVADLDLEGANETADLVRAAGRKAHVVACNVVSRRQVQEAADACVEALGRLDVAVANAGIARGGSLLEMDEKEWQDQVDVNLTGVFLTAQAAAQRMVQLGGGGRIVAIASLAAEITGPMTWGYSATKAGVRMMVRGWAQELGPHGILVNAIGPGIIDTPLASALAGDEGGPIRTRLEAHTPVGRVGTPADVGGLIAWLAGPDAGFMTGSYLILDGGFRDAGRGEGFVASDPDDPRVKEVVRHMTEGAARRARMQALLDDRD